MSAFVNHSLRRQERSSSRRRWERSRCVHKVLFRFHHPWLNSHEQIELWCKETPKACRNFLALVMEGQCFETDRSQTPNAHQSKIQDTMTASSSTGLSQALSHRQVILQEREWVVTLSTVVGHMSLGRRGHNEAYATITEPFENEVHSRLKFNRRGLIAFANNGDKRSNTSQWFITLGQSFPDSL